MIDAKNLSLTYKQDKTAVEAISEVSFSLERGSSLSIIGPSGCGKSSLLFLLAGLHQPTSGNVLVDGKKPLEAAQDTSLILQDYGLFPWKTVYENAALGLKVRGIPKKQLRDIVEPILHKLGLEAFTDHYPSQLSGGMRQRVAIARSLALKPKLLLMDEPLSSLDALTRENLQQFILDIWRENQLTLVTVTHSIEEAVFLGSKILVMSARPARILELIDNPMAGTSGYRQDNAYLQVCSKLRRMLGVAS